MACQAMPECVWTCQITPRHVWLPASELRAMYIVVFLFNIRLLENGKLDEAQAEKLRIEQVMREKSFSVC